MTATNVTENLLVIEAEGAARARAAQTSADLDTLHTEYLGRMGKMTLLMKAIGTLPAEEKPLFGQALNASKGAAAQRHQ